MMNVPIGLLLLDTRFPRPVGDIGNVDTFPFPMLQHRVEGASARAALTSDPSTLLPAFVAGASALVARGAGAVTTSCGFLVLFQDDLDACVPVPVETSPLLLVPRIAAGLPPGRRVGVLTIAASRLSASHLAAAGAPADTPVGSLEGRGAFTRSIIEDAPTLDMEDARKAHVAAARDLMARHPDLGAIVLECTNMGPYADAIRKDLGVPVHGAVELVHALHARVQRS